jgi:hypothetical protein
MKPRIYTEKRGFFLHFVFASLRASLLTLFILIAFSIGFGQSTSQNFPTPITSNEISGTIKARDVGDARLTSYFYTFNSNQGDVFINIVTKNLNGDIDVFNAANLNPLTKIVVYADSSQNETGRVIYLRKPEKLILRIQGRTPNDEPATFTIKFAGSFQPAQAVAETEQSKLPEVKSENQSDVIVNSVGTIIGVKPKPTPTPTETVSEAEENEKQETGVEKDDARKVKIPDEPLRELDEAKKTPETPTEEKAETEKQPEKKVEVVVTDNIPAQETTEPAAKTENAETKTTPAKSRTKRAASRTKKAREKLAEKPAAPNPLENVRLIVLFKDGSKIERPMSEVLRVNVDNKGMLTIVSKDGTIGRYSILDVAKMTIE